MTMGVRRVKRFNSGKVSSSISRDKSDANRDVYIIIYDFEDNKLVRVAADIAKPKLSVCTRITTCSDNLQIIISYLLCISV